MKKQLLLSTLVASLSIGSAFAQSTTMSPNTTSTSSGAFIATQNANQMLSSNLIGTDVYSTANENIGEVNDLVLDQNGNVSALVIGVGGFLGIGEKNVAIPFQAVDMSMRAKPGVGTTARVGNDQLMIKATKAELQSAPAFRKYTSASSETGSSMTNSSMTSPNTTDTRSNIPSTTGTVNTNPANSGNYGADQEGNVNQNRTGTPRSGSGSAY